MSTRYSPKRSNDLRMTPGSDRDQRSELERTSPHALIDSSMCLSRQRRGWIAEHKKYAMFDENSEGMISVEASYIPGIEDRNASLFKIPHVARDNHKVVMQGRCRQQRIHAGYRRSVAPKLMRNNAPTIRDARIHRKNAPGKARNTLANFTQGQNA